MEFLPSTGNLGPFALLVLGFGFVIFVHELGHFLVAKWVGIKVTQFAIGFGPCVVAWRKGIGFRWGSTEPEYQRRLLEYANQHLADAEREQLQLKEKTAADHPLPPAVVERLRQELGWGETEYRCNWLPLGGYVKMLGQEDMDPTARSDDPRAYGAKPIWARAAVISAGVTMNLIFAVVFFIIAFMAGVKFPPAIAGEVGFDSPAAKAVAMGYENKPDFPRGIRMGDHVVEIDGEKATDFMEIQVASALSSPGRSLRVAVERPGQPSRLVFNITPEIDAGTGLYALGVGTPQSLVVKLPPKETMPAWLARAGIEQGMRVTAVNGERITRFDQFAPVVLKAQGRPVPVTFVDEKSGATKTVEFRAEPTLVLKEKPSTDQKGKDAPKEYYPPNLLGLVPATTVREVLPNTPAARAGLRAGDVFQQVGDVAWPRPDQVSLTVVAAGSKPVAVTVLRDGQPITVNITPDRRHLLGIVRGIELPYVSDVVPEFPAATLDLNLTPGSRVLRLNGQSVQSFADLQRMLTDAVSAEPGARKVKLACALGVKGNPTVEAELAVSADAAKELAGADWVLPFHGFEVLRVPVAADDPVGAAKLGLKKTKEFMIQTYLTLARLFQGRVGLPQLRGPWGIAEAGTQITREFGWQYLMFFLGVISVNLVVINFLPIPVVDGGHIVFLLIEKLKGSPVNVKIQAAATYVGLALIAGLVLVVTWFDVVRSLKP